MMRESIFEVNFYGSVQFLCFHHSTTTLRSFQRFPLRTTNKYQFKFNSLKMLIKAFALGVFFIRFYKYNKRKSNIKIRPKAGSNPRCSMRFASQYDQRAMVTVPRAPQKPQSRATHPKAFLHLFKFLYSVQRH